MGPIRLGGHQGFRPTMGLDFAKLLRATSFDERMAKIPGGKATFHCLGERHRINTCNRMIVLVQGVQDQQSPLSPCQFQDADGITLELHQTSHRTSHQTAATQLGRVHGWSGDALEMASNFRRAKFPTRCSD
jgi:hypothetical protein